MKVPVHSLIPLILDTALARGARARLTVTGSSMQPFLREGDVVELHAPDAKRVHPGDLVLIQRSDTTYVLHRVARVVGDAFWLLGDAQTDCEGPFHHGQIVAVIVAAWRGPRAIPIRPCVWRIWLWLRPWRTLLLRTGWKMRRLTRRSTPKGEDGI